MKKLKQAYTKLPFRNEKVQLALFLVGFGIIGGLVIIFSQAATSSGSAEPEAGTLNGLVSRVDDGNASSGSYVKFGPVATGTTQFLEAFNTDTRARFDWQLQTTQEPPQRSFLGEHNASCGPGTTYRTVQSVPLQPGVAHSKVDITNSQLVWWCAEPGNAGQGHIMTGLDTDSITALAFSPKNVFTNVKKVCWDQNMINHGGGKWLNMMIVPNADVTAKANDLNYVAGASMTFHSSNQFLPAGAVDFTWFRGTILSNKIASDGAYNEGFNVWMSMDPQDTNGDGEVGFGDAPTRGMSTDPDKLFTICVNDATNKVTIERPTGELDTYDYNISFPSGQVRVILQDASKTPTRYYATSKHFTWHWDNITVE